MKAYRSGPPPFKTHYKSFSGYGIPMKPIEMITETEALSRATYYVGYYNTDEQLIRFEKYFKGALFFQHNYTYHENGKVKENRILDADGKIKTNQYDNHGRPENTVI